MIVTCPACETRYLVDQAELGGEAGRRVRCASCGNLWHYSAEAAAIHLAVAAITAELTAAQADSRPAAPAIASTAPPAPALRAEPGTQAPPPPLGAVTTAARPPVTPPPTVAVRRPPAGGAWLLAVALIAALAMIVILGRDKLALYPPITALYHRLHLAVPASSGLRITTNVSREGDTLTVGGDIVNDSPEPQPLSRLRVTLRDGDRHAVETRIIAPPMARLPPGLTVYYSTTFERPRITVAGAEVSFAGE